MDKPIDVVYILGQGSHWRNNEIKYSIKSVRKYLKGFRDIYIIGENPYIIDDIKHIRADDPYRYNKEANICHKIKIACEHPEISDDFLFMNDDHFLLHEINVNDILPYCKPDSDLYPGEKNLTTYQISRLNTWKALKDKGHTTYNYDIHTPIIYNKKNFLEAIKQYPWDQDETGFLVKSMYGNTLNLGYHPYPDCKLKTEMNRMEIEDRVNGRWVFSISDHAINQDLTEFMEDEYSNRKPELIEEDKKVSVIIPLYNQGQYLDECVDSVLRQTYQNFEIIIVDDCSTDESYKVALKQKEKSDKIKVFKHKVNKKLPATRNTAIKNATGEYILPLDSDDKIHPDMLKELVQVMNSGYDIAYSDGQDFGTSSNRFRTWDNWDPERIKTNNLLCCCSMFRRSDWEDVGGYDERLTDGFEDWMFWIVLAHNGKVGKRIPKHYFYYRQTGLGMHHYSKSIRPKIISQMHSYYPEIFGGKK